MISVVIPIYKVEQFIARCAESLFTQTLQDVEYIFVDDATPDGSMQVLQSVIDRFPERKEQIRIVRHEQNKGLPAARNTGLALAKGEYVFHCDSDDFVEPDMLQCLYEKAVTEDADIVWCDWWLSFEKNERYMKQPEFASPIEALKAMLGGGMKYNVWNKLVRRSLYVDNAIEFPAGYGMGEDMTMMMLFACAKTGAYMPRAFYHYVKTNGEAFTNTFSDKHLTAIKYNTARTIDFVASRLGAEFDNDLLWFKLSVKFPFLISDDEKMYQLWTEWFPEANGMIMSNPYMSLRSRLLQYAASKSYFWALKLYYKLVYKFVYGIIYK